MISSRPPDSVVSVAPAAASVAKANPAGKVNETSPKLTTAIHALGRRDSHPTLRSNGFIKIPYVLLLNPERLCKDYTSRLASLGSRAIAPNLRLFAAADAKFRRRPVSPRPKLAQGATSVAPRSGTQGATTPRSIRIGWVDVHDSHRPRRPCLRLVAAIGIG